LDLAVLRTRGTIATYANDGGGKPVELDVRAVPIPGDACAGAAIRRSRRPSSPL
jgi:hypothetical protein